jgi:hypothetical protein
MPSTTRCCGVVALAALSAVLALPVAPVRSSSSGRGLELLGYLENWVDVKWWDNNMPGNCYQGCFEPDAFIKASAPYTSLNYGKLLSLRLYYRFATLPQ